MHFLKSSCNTKVIFLLTFKTKNLLYNEFIGFYYYSISFNLVLTAFTELRIKDKLLWLDYKSSQNIFLISNQNT